MKGLIPLIKVSQANVWIHRTIKPLYANTQSTPKSVFLDPAWDKHVDIYPGTALVKQAGQQVTVVSAATHVVYGLAAFYEAPTFGVSEITDQGINATAAWVLGPDAEFQIIAPAFDSTLTWTDNPGAGEFTLISAYYTNSGYTNTAGVISKAQGQLCPLGTSNALTVPFARLLSVDSPTQITIGGLDPASFNNL